MLGRGARGGPAAVGKAAVDEGRMLRKTRQTRPSESIHRSLIHSKRLENGTFSWLSCQFRSSQIQSVTNAKLVPTVVDVVEMMPR